MKIEIARRHFIEASKEFNFTFLSPYCLDEESGLVVFGYMPEYGSPNGAAFELNFSPDYEINREMYKLCNENNIFCSTLCVDPFLIGEYDPAYFKELLDDWKIW